MKKIVWTFGLIGGVIVSLMMAITLPFQHSISSSSALLVGYTTMVLAFLMVFFGVRAYRDNIGGGSVGFGRAFAVGALIAVITSLCYVATWEVIYFKFTPNFLSEYQAKEVEKARASGATEAELNAMIEKNKKFHEMYQNPAFNAAVTLVEPLPVGLVVALVSAGVLSRKRKSTGAPVAA